MRYTFILLTYILFTLSACAQSKPEKEIHWLSIEEAQNQMKVLPKKVYIDIYTDWCGWCKVMEKKTFSNPSVIDYMDQNYYAVRLNAETADSLFFNGKKYGRLPDSKTNQLAAEFMQYKMSYPTSIFCDERFANPNPVPGYLDVHTIEMILKYIGTNQHKSVPFDKYQAEFKATWPVLNP